MFSDERALLAGVDRLKWWFGQFFLTNIFFIPFMVGTLNPKNPKPYKF
jgi:hypothetical protein